MMEGKNDPAWIDRNSTFRLLTWGPLFLVLAAITYTVLKGEQIEFNQEQWDIGDCELSTERYKMLDDLLERYDFSGWTVAEVESLLGCAYSRTDSTLTIYAGEDYGWNIDPESIYYLVFTLDQNGFVVNVHVDCHGYC